MSEQKPLMVCLVRRKSDGKIRCDMPDGITRYVTDEEWPEVQRIQREHGLKKEREREIQFLCARLSQLESEKFNGCSGSHPY